MVIVNRIKDSYEQVVT